MMVSCSLEVNSNPDQPRLVEVVSSWRMVSVGNTDPVGDVVSICEICTFCSQEDCATKPCSVTYTCTDSCTDWCLLFAGVFTAHAISIKGQSQLHRMRFQRLGAQ